jgi:enoyl-CoA hydratase/carnithine racemase
MPGKSMNVIDISVMDELEALIEDIRTNDAIKGAVVTSGKETFSGGADLSMLQALLGVSRNTRRGWPRAGDQKLCSTRPAASANAICRLETAASRWRGDQRHLRRRRLRTGARLPRIASPPTTRRSRSACRKSGSG